MAAARAAQLEHSHTFRAWFDALWGYYDLGDGLIAVDRAYTNAAGEPRFGGFAAVPADDPAALEAAVARCEADPATTATYVRQATIHPTTDRTGGRRGGREASAHIAWLWADVDTLDGLHAVNDAPESLPLPDREQALELLAKTPWGPPTLVVSSGGGLYPIWGLDDPLDAQAPETQDLLDRFDHHLTTTFNRAGFYIDAGVASDLARVLRPFGATNRKRRRPVPVEVVEMRDTLRYSPDEISSFLPPVPTPPPALRAPGEGGDRPGDRFASEPAALRVMLEAAGLSPVRGARWVYPRPDGSLSRDGSGHAAILNGDDGVDRIYAYPGTRLEHDWGIRGRAWSAFDVLAQRFCEEDYSLAARVVNAAEGDPGEVAAIVAGKTAEEIAAGIPGTAVLPTSPTQGGGGDVAALPSYHVPDPLLPWEVRGTWSLNEALTSETPMWVPVADDPARFVIADRERAYGLWNRTAKTVKNPETGDDEVVESFTRITTYIAWRQATTSVLAVQALGTTQPVAEVYDVVILTARGSRHTLPGLTAEVADSLPKVVAAANAGVELPEDQWGRAAAGNMLRQLGHAEQERKLAYTACGWTYDPAMRPFFAAPRGSMNADGPLPGVKAEAPVGSAEGALETEPLGAISVCNLPPDAAALRRAFDTVRLALDVTPERPEIAVAILGTVFAAPLLLKVRGVPYLQGEPSAGKSVLATIPSAFQTREPVGTDRLPINLGSASRVGVDLRVGWARGLTVQGDDFRIEGLTPRQVEQAQAAVQAIVTGGYGAGADSKATQARGFAASPGTQGATIVTSEVAPMTGQQSERAIHLRVRKGDAALDGVGNAYDTWRRAAERGPANDLFGAYIQWLAQQIEAHPQGLEGWKADNDALADAWADERPFGRHARTVASVHAGWVRLREFAGAHGMEDALPEEGRVAAALDVLVAGNVEAADGVNVGRRIVSMIRELVESGAATFSTTSNTPVDDPLRWGWRRRAVPGDPADRWAGGDRSAPLVAPPVELGWLTGTAATPDRDRRVILSRSGLKTVMDRIYGRGGWAMDTALRAVAEVCEVGRDGSPETRKRFGDEPRRAGFAFRLETLGFDRGAEDAPDDVDEGVGGVEPVARCEPQVAARPPAPVLPSRSEGSCPHGVPAVGDCLECDEF